VRASTRIVNHEEQVYLDSPETVSVQAGIPGADGNALVIRPHHRPGESAVGGKPLDFVSGRIDTRDRFHFEYGAASARMRLPAGPGLWPAFWAMGLGPWPDCGEIDIMECVGEVDWVGCAVHGPGYSGEGGLDNRFFFPSGTDATDWHVYGVVWVPGMITFEVDGRTVYRATRPMGEFFGEWPFDGERYLIINLALGGTYPFKTNGIDMPYYGLPRETVDTIAAGEASLLVDWVRVEGLEDSRGGAAVAAPSV
jgi:hypothetical protein